MTYFCISAHDFTTKHKTLKDARKEARKNVYHTYISSNQIAEGTKDNIIGKVYADNNTTYWFDLRKYYSLIKTWRGEIIKYQTYSFYEILKDGSLKRLKSAVYCPNGEIYHREIRNGKEGWYFGNIRLKEE